ncbi:hypothetical protein HMPREF1550_01500 [Actinomyces sp. oral taxon 877 str. F0543]|nr:hypothetical protein HMPREF1550_01500 [Actinomyces sp. oral taxon 877 str. F0543]
MCGPSWTGTAARRSAGLFAAITGLSSGPLEHYREIPGIGQPRC